jgi:hypothetical protein
MNLDQVVTALRSAGITRPVQMLKEAKAEGSILAISWTRFAPVAANEAPNSLRLNTESPEASAAAVKIVNEIQKYGFPMDYGQLTEPQPKPTHW